MVDSAASTPDCSLERPDRDGVPHGGANGMWAEALMPDAYNQHNSVGQQVSEERPQTCNAATGNSSPNVANQASTHDQTSRNTPKPKAKYPEFIDELKRRATFRTWPARIRQSPDMMAAAGFFYALNGDSVRCFYCGIGLRNWDQDDNAWVEHARWSENCAYVLEKKGQHFINRVQEAVREAQLQQALRENNIMHGRNNNNGSNETRNNEDNDDTETDCPPPGQRERSGRHGRPFPTESERKNPLLCDAAQSVLNMGYRPKVVKQVIDELLKLEGWTGMNGAKLLKMIMDKEDVGDLDPDQSLVPSQLPPKPKTFDHKTADKTKLKEENTNLKERTMCKICCLQTVSIVILPCGHLIACAQCAPALKVCPVCRGPLKATVRISFGETDD